MGVVVVGALLILLIGSMIFKIFMFNVRLGELENRLGLTKSQKSFKPPMSVAISGLYKGSGVEIDATANLLFWKKRATKTIFRIKHSSNFNAEIKPSVGLAEEERQHQERLAREEASKKVWNPKLTSEEQKVIEERRKSQNLEGEAPKELFKVVSARLPEANRFIEQEDRQQLLRTLFKQGASLVHIGFSDVAVEFPALSEDEVTNPKFCENYFKELKKLVVQPITTER